MIPVILFDIDGTVADLRHRLHYIEGDKKNYDKFFEALDKDTVYQDALELFRILRAYYPIIFCTGRMNTYRDSTYKWLIESGFANFAGYPDFEGLYMRPEGDTRPDYIVKKELLSKIRSDGYEPWLVVEDRQTVVDMWREEGLTCLQIRDWKERSKYKPGELFLMVGPSGAGKSSWLQTRNVKHDVIVSSDRLRQELTGDFQDQSKNEQVFAALHALVKARIESGLTTYVDATNIRTKDRLALVDLVRDAEVTYIVIDRPIEDKRKTGGWRNTLENNFDLIGKHDQTFKSNLKAILNGDGRPNVTVQDHRNE